MRHNENFDLAVFMLCSIGIAYFIGMYYMNMLHGGM